MTRIRTTATFLALFVAGAFSRSGIAAPAQPERPSLAGRWTLNRQLSQFPTGVGFGMDLGAGAGSREGSAGGGGRSGNLPAGAYFQESVYDAQRREQLVDEVLNPSTHLAITQTATTVTIAQDRGRPRTFHPNGREESQELDGVGAATTARWDAGGLEVRYKVEPYRELRYTYSRSLDPAQLIVQIRFVESGGRDTVTRVYEPTRPDEPAAPESVTAPKPRPASPPASPSSGSATPAAPPSASGGPPVSDLLKPSAQGRGGAPLVPAGPDAELKGLANIGVVVEDLSSAASACGLSQAPIETAVSRSLSDAGYKVRRNSDEDTYVYVHIITSKASPSLCVSRYDAFLYTHTTATLSYQTTPLLVQVQLLHKAGMSGGAPGSHADAVMRDIKQYADEFARRIHDANR